MRPSAQTLAACLLAGGFALPWADEQPPPAAPPAVAEATWQDLVARPGHWLGRQVRVNAVWQAPVESWNPYLTRFGRGEYLALQFWSDEQPLWNEEEHAAPAVRLFVRQGSLATLELLRAQPYERFRLELVVRELFLDLPWAEVLRAERLSEQVTEASVIHAARALAEGRAGRWQMAELEFEQALAAPLPAAARSELERLRQGCREAQAHPEQPPPRPEGPQR